VLSDIILEVAFEMHKKLKTGLLCLNCDSLNSEMVTRPGVDIFGQPQGQLMISDNCECCNCSRTLIASRFAPHLEKCMGLGRTSSRLATKRIQKVEKPTKASEESDVEYPATHTFVDGDGDWKDPSYENKAKNKVRKSGLAKLPGATHKNKRIRYSSEKLDPMDPKVKALLLTTCGVISPLTGKMCTKTLKCPQHNDALRNALRELVNQLVPTDPLPLLGNDYVNGQADLHFINGNSSNSSGHDKAVDGLEEHGKNLPNGKRLFADISPTFEQQNSQSDMSPPSPLVIVDIDGDESENEYSEISSASPPPPNHEDVLKKKIKIEHIDN